MIRLVEFYEHTSFLVLLFPLYPYHFPRFLQQRDKTTKKRSEVSVYRTTSCKQLKIGKFGLHQKATTDSHVINSINQHKCLRRMIIKAVTIWLS